MMPTFLQIPDSIWWC